MLTGFVSQRVKGGIHRRATHLSCVAQQPVPARGIQFLCTDLMHLAQVLFIESANKLQLLVPSIHATVRCTPYVLVENPYTSFQRNYTTLEHKKSLCDID